MNINSMVSGMIYKGPCDGVGGLPSNQNISQGDVFHVTSNFSVGGNCYQIGDVIFANANAPGQNPNNWTIIAPAGSNAPISDEDLINHVDKKYKLNIPTEVDIEWSLFNIK